MFPTSNGTPLLKPWRCPTVKFLFSPGLFCFLHKQWNKGD